MVLAMLFGDDNCVDIHDEDWQCLMMSADFGLNSGAFEWKIWKAGVIIIVAVGRIWIKFRGL